MELEGLLKEKENLIIRFCKLTEEASLKLEAEKQEEIPLIMEKRERILQEMETLHKRLHEMDIRSKDQGPKIKELELKVLAENIELQKKMEENFKKLKGNIGNNKKAIKINKAYQGQADQSLHLNKKN